MKKEEFIKKHAHSLLDEDQVRAELDEVIAEAISEREVDVITKLNNWNIAAIKQADVFLETGKTVSEYCSRAMATAYKNAIDVVNKPYQPQERSEG